MSLANRISPRIVSLISSDELLSMQRKLREFNRKRQGRTHEVLFFHKVDDPYSHLLLQMLQQLMSDFDIKVKPQIIGTLDANMFPEPEMLAEWSLKDARLLADAFSLHFPEKNSLPDKALCQRAEKILLSNEQSDSFLKFALDVNNALWQEGEQAIQKLEEEVGRVSNEQREHLLKKSEHVLRKKGHYLSATLFYEGEWYWGVDRIYHLAQRLYDLNISKSTVDLNTYRYPSIPQSQFKAKHPLEFFFSFRSPYSYLACQRLNKLKDTYQLDIQIRPVLPMVMRGLPVPRSKKMYIFLDTKRECNRYGIPFGRTVDPLGEGVNRCMAILSYAQQEGKALEFISSASRGIWAEGEDVTQDETLKRLTERSGLSWENAKAFLNKNDWEKDAEQNRLDMIAMGFWGVPSFRYGNQSFWGQDRLWVIEQQISRE